MAAQWRHQPEIIASEESWAAAKRLAGGNQ